MSDERRLPKYPIYIPTKGRADRCLTAEFLRADEVPFFLVVEPQERDEYAERFGDDCVLTLPFRDLGSPIPARNWIKAHSVERGDARHWQLDDNISRVYRLYKGERLYCHSGVALRVVEDFTDRYENVAVSGMNYTMFAVTGGAAAPPPFYLNVRVYSCSLILNAVEAEWRGEYNSDTDFCLQVLAAGWCTVLVNVFNVQKKPTMMVKGGNTERYQGDGRLKIARSLERAWPGVVTTRRRFKRPQHAVKGAWRHFDTPLRRRLDLDFESLPPVDEYGMKLVQKAPSIKSKKLRKLVDEYNEKPGKRAKSGKRSRRGRSPAKI